MVYGNFIISTKGSNTLKQKYFIHQTVQQVTSDLAYHLFSMLSFKCIFPIFKLDARHFLQVLKYGLRSLILGSIFIVYNYLDQTLSFRLWLASNLYNFGVTFLIGNSTEKKKMFCFVFLKGLAWEDNMEILLKYLFCEGLLFCSEIQQQHVLVIPLSTLFQFRRDR